MYRVCKVVRQLGVGERLEIAAVANSADELYRIKQKLGNNLGKFVVLDQNDEEIDWDDVEA